MTEDEPKIVAAFAPSIPMWAIYKEISSFGAKEKRAAFPIIAIAVDEDGDLHYYDFTADGCHIPSATETSNFVELTMTPPIDHEEITQEEILDRIAVSFVLDDEKPGEI